MSKTSNPCWQCRTLPARSTGQVPVCGQHCFELLEDKPKPYSYGDIEALTLDNKDYRRVLDTSQQAQLVLMCIQPSESIPAEVHEHTTQFIRVESGTGYILINQQHRIKLDTFKNDFALIHAGTEHEVVVTGKEPLKLYTVYSPPHHPRDLVQHRQL